jgi:S-methylmethionine-dependent homocysteine/selenocysteine methylase
VVAAGVNCCAPEEVTAAVECATAATGKPAVAYPNSGETWDPSAARWRGRPGFTPDLALTWQAAGARLIGGCCRVGPATIAELAALLGR